MTNDFQVMADTIGATAHNIPDSMPRIGGYITGTNDILWPKAQFVRFGGKPMARINQSPDPGSTGGNVRDVEDRAGTIAGAVEWAKKTPGPSIYIQESRVNELTLALKAAGIVTCSLWIADWNLSQDQAVARLKTRVNGYPVQAVQWASPSSNPATLVPGTKMTLKAANVDLSVTVPGWLVPVTAPVTPPAKIVITFTSTDGGKTWAKT